MTCNCCSGNFSTSCRCCLPSSSSFGDSSCPRNPVYTTSSCSARTCQLESSLNTGCQETCIEPIRCQRSCVMSSPCQMPCYYPRSSTSCSPCQEIYAGTLCFGPSSFHSQDCGSSRYFIVGHGPSSFESLYYRVSGLPSQSYGSRFCYSTYLPAGTWQLCYKPTCSNILYGLY